MIKFIEKDFYKKIIEVMPIPSVDVILFNKDLSKVLLFKRNNAPAKGQYYSLGGRLYKDEEFIECAKRKAKEEIGLDLDEKNLKFVGIANEFWEGSPFDEGINSHYINIYFATRLEENSKFFLDEQHSQAKWFDSNDKSINKLLREKIIKSINCLR